jgi:hypothetical protein
MRRAFWLESGRWRSTITIPTSKGCRIARSKRRRFDFHGVPVSAGACARRRASLRTQHDRHRHREQRRRATAPGCGARRVFERRAAERVSSSDSLGSIRQGHGGQRASARCLRQAGHVHLDPMHARSATNHEQHLSVRPPERQIGAAGEGADLFAIRADDGSA